jgi:integrase
MLPPKVHSRHGRYFYVHQNKWHPLSRIDEGTTALYTALQEFVSDRPATYGQLMMLYIARALPELKPATRPEYLRIINARLQHHFGGVRLNALEPTHIAQYLEMRKNEGAAIGGNRERAVLGSIISWGMRFGWCVSNPCHGVKRNREAPGRRYVTDQELKGVIDRASPALQDLLAVAFLTGLRQGDLRTLTRENITASGIKLRQSKDGKLREIEWSEPLKYFISRALARSARDEVFVGEKGKPYSMDGLQSAMRRLNAGFRFRELRPKAASDASHNVLGHSAQMLATYIRRTVIKPVR